MAEKLVGAGGGVFDEGGQVMEPQVDVVAPVSADRLAGGPMEIVATTYLQPEDDILASSVGLVVTSYTFDSTAITADANGNKIVYEGTVLTNSGVGLAAPRTGAAVAIGVLRERLNAIDNTVDLIGMVVGGHLLRPRLRDNGVLGTVAPSAVSDLAALGVFLKDYQA